MAKQGGLGDNFYLAGNDLSGDVNSLSRISGPQGTFDWTTINKSAFVRAGAIRDGVIDFTTLFDPSGAGPFVAGPAPLQALSRADQIASYFRGTAVGNPAAAMVALQPNFDPNRGTDGSLILSVGLVADGDGLEWGKQLTPGQRTDTTATTGAFFDDTAGTAFGGQAYFQVFSVVGTSVTIDIQSATTSGGAYATTGLTSTAVTPGQAPTAQRVQVVNTTTINRFLKVVTTGTFTSAVFAVVFVRNQIAGVTF